jgi:DNA polymerase-3 subunit gamma/tau
VQLFYQIATIGRGELGLAPDEYAGFTMTLLRMLAFEPAGGPGAGGGGGARAKPAGVGVSATSARSAAPGGVTASAVRAAADVTPKVNVAPERDRVATARATETVEKPVAEAALSARSPDVETQATSGIDGEAAGISASSPASPGAEDAPGGQSVEAQASVDTSLLRTAETGVSAGSESAAGFFAPAPAPLAAAAQELAERVAAEPAEPTEPTEPTEAAPVEKLATASLRTPGGASAALDVLRSAGMRVSSDRGARPAEPARKPVTSKAAPVVQVPAPRRPAASPALTAAASDARPETSARTTNARAGANNSSAVPPWDDIPLDDYQPASSDDGYFMSADDGFVPSFESGPDDVRFNDAPDLMRSEAKPEAKPVARSDTRPLPPAIPLDAIGAIGAIGDWPALAVDLPLKGIAYQLAFNSELTACDAGSITLVVPVPQYAESAQVAKLKAALIDKLGRPLEVVVSVGAARRTAAAADAALRAERQKQAEKEITQNPFVQSLIRDFGASIVQGSIKPIAPENSSSAQGGGHNAASAN